MKDAINKNNIVLITVDSLRSDFVGHLSDRDLTPNIDALSNDGIRCERAYANGTPTYFAFQSILGGRRDIDRDSPIGIPSNWSTLADILSEEGYTTAGFNAANPWLTTEFNYDSGFDVYHDFLNSGEDKSRFSLMQTMQSVQNKLPKDGLLRDKLGLAARAYCSYTNNYPIEEAESVTKKATEWLSGLSNDKPFFLWIHYMDPHFPWTPQSDEVSNLEIATTWHEVAHVYNKSKSNPNNEVIRKVEQLYGHEVYQLDTAIGELIDALSKSGHKDDSVICLTADHGTELGDHGGFSHGPDSLYEEVVRVPLVISGPNVPEKVLSEPVQHIDIPPTLVDLAGIDITSRPIVARGWAGDVLPNIGDRPTLIQVRYDYDPAVSLEASNEKLNVLINLPWKLHYNQHSNKIELYNIEEDPGEKHDLSDTSPTIVSELKRELKEYQATVKTEENTIEEILSVRRSLSDINQT